ncbi:MAG: SurA N-terminal domain-containing protein [Zoogloeaceae bacterium]|jgi:peptidyl-prolyl cis-trans isomerase D|nr:SurA N-terminal domain-containing protein [Zoogloeaceae bacterium]
MFDAIRNNKRLVQIFLLLITVPFAVWGLDAYFQGGGDTTLATIGKIRITTVEFREALREQQDQWRQQMPNADVAVFNTPELRTALLEDMVMRQIVMLEAGRLRLDVRGFMREMILNAPEFQENGAFSEERYKSVLNMNNMSVSVFEARLQESIMQQTLRDAVQGGALAPKTVARQIAALQKETRVVEESLATWQTLLGQVEVTEAEAQQFYEANAPRFTLPEQVRVEYLVLSQKELEDKNRPDEKPARDWYDAHKAQFTLQVEKRRASHILTLGKADAEALLAELKQNPDRFAELAKAKSADPGSAQQGGDLGFFERAGMVEPFADAAFALRVGEISGVVESEFGFHIIRLTDIQPGQYRSFAEARADVETELRREGAARRFTASAEKFATLVYEQFDSLKPAADEFGLATRQSGWLTREVDPKAGGDVLQSPILLRAIFDDEVLKNGRNAKAEEIAPGVMASARLLEHRPAAPIPFGEAQRDILNFLRQEKAQALAVERGKANLAELEKAGPDAPVKPLSARLNLKWDKPRSVSRTNPGALHPLSINAIFRASGEQKPPFYTGVELPGTGYALYKINRVTAGEVKEEDLAILQQQLVRINAQTQLNAYLATLRQRYAVDINQKKLQEEGGKD